MREEERNKTSVRAEAAQLVADYSRFLDARDEQAWTGLFTTDGVIQIGPDRRIEGKDALARFLARTPRGVHVPGIPSVEIKGDIVYAHSAVIFLDSATGHSRAVVNEDRMTWVEGRLLIAERNIDIRADSQVASR